MSARAVASKAEATAGAGAARSADITHELVADRPGERLDVFLAGTLPDCSRSVAQRLIAGGSVLVDGRPLAASSRLRAGASLTVTVRAAEPSPLTPERLPLEVVYEDSDLIVLNKASGMVVHPGPGHSAHTVVHALLAHCADLSGIGGQERPGILHRLDKDTSGLLVVAKHDRAHAALSRQFAARTVTKYYLALVQGAPTPPAGLIEAPIGRHPRDRQKMAVRVDGRPARTRYQTLAREGAHTLILAGLETGRTHQLRVHFAGLGCPVAGDPIYGARGGPARRLWLHAWRLALNRPRDGARMVWEASLPPELEASWSDGLERMLDRARRLAADTGAPSASTTEETVP